jgi:hypothetical protein
VFPCVFPVGVVNAPELIAGFRSKNRVQSHAASSAEHRAASVYRIHNTHEESWECPGCSREATSGRSARAQNMFPFTEPDGWLLESCFGVRLPSKRSALVEGRSASPEVQRCSVEEPAETELT